MKEIDLSEAHQILLEIAKTFARICDKNNIPYYMLGGTMLGAVRHKGFIPWDDDMDFGVPRPYYDQLITCLERQLPYPYRCCTYNNGLSISTILKIDDCRTIISDIFNGHKYKEPIGLNIDIFPLDYCSPNDVTIKKINILRTIYNCKFSKNPSWGIMRKLFNTIVKILVPGTLSSINALTDSLLKKCTAAPYLYNVFGAWGVKECIPIDWYGEGIKYRFEDVEFSGIKEYDKYLSRLYGDYMTPPANNPHIHLSGVIWKE